MNNDDWAKRIKKLRSTLGAGHGKKTLTQTEMGNFVGVTQTQISLYEKNKKPVSATVRRLVQLAEMLPPDQIKKAGLL